MIVWHINSGRTLIEQQFCPWRPLYKTSSKLLVDALRLHHYISKAQSSYLSSLKEDLEEDDAIIMLDFAENFGFVVQDEVQGFHWNNAQATLHPFVVYYKSADELQHRSICVISDCLSMTPQLFMHSLLLWCHISSMNFRLSKKSFTLVMEQRANIRIIKTFQTFAITRKIMELMQSGIFLPLRTVRVHVTALAEQSNV